MRWNAEVRNARTVAALYTTADDYIDISPFYGMAPATVSGYHLGGRSRFMRLRRILVSPAEKPKGRSGRGGP